MIRRLVFIILTTFLLAIVMTGCEADPNEQYAEKASNIVDRWQAITAEWNARPGGPQVQADFAALEAEAKAIKPPSEMQNIHDLLLTAMEAETKSLNAYATGDKEQSILLNQIALDGMTKYKKALQNLGLVE